MQVRLRAVMFTLQPCTCVNRERSRKRRSRRLIITTDFGLDPGPRLIVEWDSTEQVTKMGGMHNALLRWAHDFGPVYKFFMGRWAIVVINGTDACLLTVSFPVSSLT